MTSSRRRSPTRYRHTQRRGDHRRERLLRAASELIERHSLRELTYAGVCKRAGVPVGSAHHFYPDLDTIYLALLDKHRAAKDAALFKPIPARSRVSWQAVVSCLIDRAVRYHRAHPVVTKIAIGGETPPNIKLWDRKSDWVRAAASMRLLGKWNWYLPSWLEWIPRISVEGPTASGPVALTAPAFEFDPGVAAGE